MASVAPVSARFDAGFGEFILPNHVVVSSPDPDAALLEFLQSTYEAAADLAGWPRAELDGLQGVLGHPAQT